MTVYVIRTTRQQELLGFFSRLGLRFVEEKHGKGPLHYACEHDGAVLEIYPGVDEDRGRFIEMMTQ